jgi:hypothetical protein
MNNLFKDYEVGDRFDLKGSTVGRRTLKEDINLNDERRDKKIALKDLDFIDHFKKIEFIRNEGKPKLEDILERDAHFFAEVEIIDYSVLIGKLLNSDAI